MNENFLNEQDMDSSWQLRLERKVDNISQALLGNDLTKDGGLIGKVNTMDKDYDERLFKLENELLKYKWIVTGIFVSVPVMTTVVVFMLKQFNIVK